MQLPVDFECSAQAGSGVKNSWHVKAGSQVAKCDVPTQFGGLGQGFSPEDFFAQALINCFVGTFKVYAEASKVTFSELSVGATLTVDKNDQGQTVMSSCHLNIRLEGVAQSERARTLVEKTLRSGFILNSVKTRISHALDIPS